MGKRFMHYKRYEDWVVRRNALQAIEDAIKKYSDRFKIVEDEDAWVYWLIPKNSKYYYKLAVFTCCDNEGWWFETETTRVDAETDIEDDDLCVDYLDLCESTEKGIIRCLPSLMKELA